MAETRKFEFKPMDFGTILSELIDIPTITDIEMRNGEVWIVDIKKGRYKYNLGERSEEEQKELNQLLFVLPRQIASRMGVAYSAGQPILDGESVYKDIGQLRINAIDNSLTGTDYPGIAIRKTTYGLRLSDEHIFDDEYVTSDFLNLMEVLLGCGCNIMITGLTGSGKTELLKYLARYIPKNEAIITIEDTFEAYLKRIYPEKEVLALKANEKHTFSDLIKTCLRQNPDWIMVSEARGEEVIDLMNAVGTGHHLISTIHSDAAINIPWRMVDMAKVDGAEQTRMFRQVHQNINIGIYIHYYNDDEGSHRKVAEVCEFYVDGNGEPKSHIIYEYDYETRTYRSEKIVSSAIKNKIVRSKINSDKIRGKFLDGTNDKYAKVIKSVKEQIETCIKQGPNKQESIWESVIATGLRGIVNAVNAETGTCWYENENEIIYPIITYNAGELFGIRLHSGQGIAGAVIASGKPEIIEDCKKDSRWDKHSDERLGFETQTMVAVPFKLEGKVAGCVQILNRKNEVLFDMADLQFVQSLTDGISSIFDNYNNKIKPTMESLCKKLDSIEAKGNSK